MSQAHTQAILLVDGYNVIGAWMRLQQLRDRQGLAAARRELVEILVGYSAYQGFETQLVFDSQYQTHPGSREIITGSLTVCYTNYRQTADTYIERACSLFRKDIRKFDHRLIVATSDRAQRLTVVGYGAEWMSAEQLRADVEFTNVRLTRRQKTERKKQSSNRLLAHSLDPIARQRLLQMRMGKKKGDG